MTIDLNTLPMKKKLLRQVVEAQAERERLIALKRRCLAPGCNNLLVPYEVEEGVRKKPEANQNFASRTSCSYECSRAIATITTRENRRRERRIRVQETVDKVDPTYAQWGFLT